MRIRPAVASLCFAAACGAHAAPASPENHATAPAPAHASAPGTTGLPGLDWGATADKVAAAVPDAKPGARGLVAHATVEGRAATVTYVVDGTGLNQIVVDWPDAYPSMDACLKDWTALRATMDQRLGASQSDNGAAYWKSGQDQITLACNPGDTGGAQMSETTEPADPS